MYIILLGVNHKTAPIEIREKLAMSKPQIKKNAANLKLLNEVEGVIVLSTCNRTEFYIATKNLNNGREELVNFILSYSQCTQSQLENNFYIKECYNAVQHLFRVTAGLESMILGESQILGQVQDAYEYALEFKLSNKVLNTLFQNAIMVGKRVRTETMVDRQAVSISSAAVNLAKRFFGNGLEGKNVLVLGAGETSQLTLKHLIANGVSTVVVANRTFERALKLAKEYGGQAIRFDQLNENLITADIIISCTSAPKYILEVKDIVPALKKRNGNPILIIDIAVPRDINPDIAELQNISLYDVDDLKEVVQQNLAERMKEAVKAQCIIKEELASFFKWLDSLFVIPTIVALKEKGQFIKDNEINRALRRLSHLTEKEIRVIESMANAIVNQLIHCPIANLKEYAHTSEGVTYVDAIHKLFGLEDDAEKLEKWSITN